MGAGVDVDVIFGLITRQCDAKLGMSLRHVSCDGLAQDI